MIPYTISEHGMGEQMGLCHDSLHIVAAEDNEGTDVYI